MNIPFENKRILCKKQEIRPGNKPFLQILTKLFFVQDQICYCVRGFPNSLVLSTSISLFSGEKHKVIDYFSAGNHCGRCCIKINLVLYFINLLNACFCLKKQIFY